MSDLYLVLRSRLEAVTNWVSLGTEVMERARKSKGLSYEAVSRQANVSSKTYERYEKAGRVPEHQISNFADILGLEIERPVRQRVIIEDSETIELDRISGLEAQVEALRLGQRQVLDLLREIRGGGEEPGQRRTRKR